MAQECLNLGLHHEKLRVTPQAGVVLDGAEYLRGVVKELGLELR